MLGTFVTFITKTIRAYAHDKPGRQTNMCMWWNEYSMNWCPGISNRIDFVIITSNNNHFDLLHES